ncbi:unnamed protein product [Ostreobium quekettii]|uniref:Cytochrome P450 n=1 Tax=Ostreobium quekettii TaxID=121088 RepID=A0A8S1J012_9CHLO|nr:unnamed protein product [Ostreobium quekettii]|eukprot:evm.model.scf_1693.3 EVM.evm.TU.scf_1693.3   scf_1693:20445-26269(+)
MRAHRAALGPGAAVAATQPTARSVAAVRRQGVAPCRQWTFPMAQLAALRGPRLPMQHVLSPSGADSSRGGGAGRGRGGIACRATLAEVLTGVGLFFTPGALACLYALYLGKGDFGDGLSRLLTQVSRGYFQHNLGGDHVPICDGKLSDLTGDKPLFTFLYDWFVRQGGVYKLEFGPKAFLVVSDPVVVRHIIKENYDNYDKGVLAEILEPIMGKGLIPADLETWKPRRRAIAPAFHKAFLETMMEMYGKCTERCIQKFDGLLSSGSTPTVDMEKEFLNLGLDIIGLGVFNVDFGSINEESPVIQAVYGVLKEAEHRSTTYFPYWDLPLARYLVPRQREFHADLAVINGCLDDLISQAKSTRQEEDLEHLQNRDYSKVTDPSLLRFLVDLRGEDASDMQLRDDLMTMLIAGHETTAAVLTWSLFLLSQSSEWQQKVLDEVDDVVGDAVPDLEAIKGLPSLRAVLAESLRLYPQPPILIRRALADDVLPPGLGGHPDGYPVGKGADLFISSWNLHRSPHTWRDPHEFHPERFSETFTNDNFEGHWAGFDPSAGGNSLYPNEASSDFAFIPFGGGARKCVGDQFAFLEAALIMAMLLRRFRFRLTGRPEDMRMATGATIHTADGLMMTVERRTPGGAVEAKEEGEVVVLSPA